MAAAEITRLLQPSILTEEEKAKCLIDMLGNNSKLTHSLQDKFFDKLQDKFFEAFINRFNAGLEKRIIESKLDLDTSRKDKLYKQTEAALREVLSAGPGSGGQASRSCLQSQRVQANRRGKP